MLRCAWRARCSASWRVTRGRWLSRRATAVSASSSAARPDLADVERLTRGESAKRRGTGSREVPHRLNADERAIWDLARKRSFMVLAGAGYRRERRGSPLMNSWRQYADAVACPAIFCHHGAANADASEDGSDAVVTVDLSPLRCESAVGFASARDACVAVSTEGAEQPPYRVVRDDLSSTCEVDVLASDHWATQPIWKLPPLCVTFACADRPHAKALAERLASRLCGKPVGAVKLKSGHPKRMVVDDDDADDDGTDVR